LLWSCSSWWRSST